MTNIDFGLHDLFEYANPRLAASESGLGTCSFRGEDKLEGGVKLSLKIKLMQWQ
jgi:hypothetical protein